MYDNGGNSSGGHYSITRTILRTVTLGHKLSAIIQDGLWARGHATELPVSLWPCLICIITWQEMVGCALNLETRAAWNLRSISVSTVGVACRLNWAAMYKWNATFCLVVLFAVRVPQTYYNKRLISSATFPMECEVVPAHSADPPFWVHIGYSANSLIGPCSMIDYTVPVVASVTYPETVCDCLASDLAPYDYWKSHGRIFLPFSF